MINKFANYSFFLLTPWHLLFLIHGTILGGILLSRFSFLDTTYRIWNNLGNKEEKEFPWKKFLFLYTIFFIIIAAYFYEIPFRKTGLFHMLIGSAKQPEAREFSLKNMNNVWIRYFYALMKGSLAPVLVLILFNFSYKSKKLFFTLPLMISTISLSNMNAEKSFLLHYMLMILFYFAYKYKMDLKKRTIFLFLLLILFCIFLPSILVYNINYSLSPYLLSKIERIFLVPLKVGIWYIHDTQFYGLDWRLAFPNSLFSFGNNLKFNYANYIGQKYVWYYLGHKTLDSVNANSSFIFNFYKGTGVLAVFPSIIAVLLLDFCVLIYEKIRKDMLLVLLAILATKCLSFISINFFTGFFSNGFIFSILIILFWSRIKKVV